MSDTTELLLVPQQLELIFKDGTELVFVDQGLEFAVQADAEVVINNSEIEIVAIDAAPQWVYSTKVTVSSTPPVSPKLNDIWIVKA